MQTIAGIVLGGVVYTILVQSPAIRTLKGKICVKFRPVLLKNDFRLF